MDIYLFEWQNYIEEYMHTRTRTHTHPLHCLVHFSNCRTRLKLGARSFSQVSLHVSGMADIWCCARYFNMNLDHKWSHQNSNQSSYGMPAL